MPESHVAKTTCDLDVSQSPFGGCTTPMELHFTRKNPECDRYTFLEILVHRPC